VQIHVLGSAAGGGVPQWNCGCANCEGARDGRLSSRTQASIAVSADGNSWILFNATTDVRLQIERTSLLRRAGLRGSPIEAVFLTDANVDHTAGLLDFRQAGAWSVFSTTTVRDVLTENPMFRPFAVPPRSWRSVDETGVSVSGLRIAPIPVAGLLPSYTGSVQAEGAVTAFDIEDGLGARVVYAPIYLEPGAALARAVDGASAAFLDGSFWTDDEMIALGLGTRTAREMGHAPVSGPGGSLEALASARAGLTCFTHVNNSNPMLDPASESGARVAREGFAIAEDGMTLVLDGAAHRIDSHA
jgi:pyrroloquinoline quinone biosynthesis protein B